MLDLIPLIHSRVIKPIMGWNLLPLFMAWVVGVRPVNECAIGVWYYPLLDKYWCVKSLLHSMVLTIRFRHPIHSRINSSHVPHHHCSHPLHHLVDASRPVPEAASHLFENIIKRQHCSSSAWQCLTDHVGSLSIGIWVCRLINELDCLAPACRTLGMRSLSCGSDLVAAVAIQFHCIVL